MAIKVGFEYLETTVASYELYTPFHMNGNKTIIMSTVYLYHCHVILLKNLWHLYAVG